MDARHDVGEHKASPRLGRVSLGQCWAPRFSPTLNGGCQHHGQCNHERCHEQDSRSDSDRTEGELITGLTLARHIHAQNPPGDLVIATEMMYANIASAAANAASRMCLVRPCFKATLPSAM